MSHFKYTSLKVTLSDLSTCSYTCNVITFKNTPLSATDHLITPQTDDIPQIYLNTDHSLQDHVNSTTQADNSYYVKFTTPSLYILTNMADQQVLAS